MIQKSRKKWWIFSQKVLYFPYKTAKKLLNEHWILEALRIIYIRLINRSKQSILYFNTEYWVFIKSAPEHCKTSCTKSINSTNFNINRSHKLGIAASHNVLSFHQFRQWWLRCWLLICMMKLWFFSFGFIHGGCLVGWCIDKRK